VKLLIKLILVPSSSFSSMAGYFQFQLICSVHFQFYLNELTFGQNQPVDMTNKN